MFTHRVLCVMSYFVVCYTLRRWVQCFVICHFVLSSTITRCSQSWTVICHWVNRFHIHTGCVWIARVSVRISQSVIASKIQCRFSVVTSSLTQLCHVRVCVCHYKFVTFVVSCQLHLRKLVDCRVHIQSCHFSVAQLCHWFLLSAFVIPDSTSHRINDCDI